MLSALFLTGKKFQAALVCARRAVVCASDSVFTRFQLGRVYYALGDYTGCANALLPFLSTKANRNYFGPYESEAITGRRENEFQSCLAAAR